MRWLLLLGALLLAGGGAAAQLEEVFSQHVRVFRPDGEFAQQLIRLRPPSGGGWKEVGGAEAGYRIAIPAGAEADTAVSGSRVLQVTLSDGPTRPRPILRIDFFTPGPGDPTEVDREYAADFAEEYPDRAFEGKFTVIDSGMLVVRKPRLNLAMVGGVYPQGAVRAYRLQCVSLSKERHAFVTFDCAEQEWPRYSETLAQILLSLEFPRRKR